MTLNRFASILAIAIMFLPADSTSTEKVPTNEEMVVNAISRSSMALIDSLNLSLSTVYIKKESGIAALAVDGLKSAFLSAGWSVRSQFDGDDLAGYVLTLSLSAFEFEYQSGSSRGFLKKPYIRRNLSGQLLLNLEDDDFSYVGFTEFSDSDSVSPDQANYIASLRYKQLAPAVPGSLVTKYLEPLAVTATVGGLIYLFFVNR